MELQGFMERQKIPSYFLNVTKFIAEGSHAHCTPQGHSGSCRNLLPLSKNFRIVGIHSMCNSTMLTLTYRSKVTTSTLYHGPQLFEFSKQVASQVSQCLLRLCILEQVYNPFIVPVTQEKTRTKKKTTSVLD